jgi:hypothetical protein
MWITARQASPSAAYRTRLNTVENKPPAARPLSGGVCMSWQGASGRFKCPTCNGRYKLVRAKAGRESFKGTIECYYMAVH